MGSSVVVNIYCILRVASYKYYVIMFADKNIIRATGSLLSKNVLTLLRFVSLHESAVATSLDAIVSISYPCEMTAATF